MIVSEAVFNEVRKRCSRAISQAAAAAEARILSGPLPPLTGLQVPAFGAQNDQKAYLVELEEALPDEELKRLGVSWDIVQGILFHILLVAIRTTSRMHRAKLGQYLQRYQQGHRIADIALASNFSPYMLARMVVEHSEGSQLSKNKKALTKLIRNPSQIQDWRLRKELAHCISIDPSCSPDFDRVRNVIGSEGEYLLERSLSTLEISFQPERELRDLGMSKTPDIRLDIPIGMVGPQGEARAIHWIDCKAMFGDPPTHRQNKPQLEGYVNRFGPGAVLYTVGFVEELNVDGTVLLLDALPNEIVSIIR